MVTLKDIALDCHVSLAVVSRALNPNSDGRVAKETRLRIEESMRRLHYHRNHAAAMLAMGRCAALGIFLPNYKDALIAELVMGVSEAASKYDFNCRFFFGQDGSDYLRFMEKLGDMGSSGILTYPIDDKRGDELRMALVEYRKRGGRVTVLNSMVSYQDGIESISLDNEYGGRLAAEHLLSLGCTSFSLLTVDMKSPTNEARCNGFVHRLQEDGLGVSLHPIKSGNYHHYDYKALEDAIFKIDKSPKEGIFAVNDYLALAFLRKMQQLGRIGEVGKSIRLVGYDDNMAASFSIPTLTSIRQPMRQLAHEATLRMISQIVGAPTRNQLPLPELIERES